MAPSFLPDDWLADALGRPTYSLPRPRGAVSAPQLSAEMSLTSQAGPTFFYCKVPTLQVTEVSSLSRAGFSVVDTGIGLRWRGSADPLPSNQPAEVVAATAAHREGVVHLAGECFRWSRFHLDPRIPKALADHVKRRWMESYFAGERGAALYVAEVGGEVAGFLGVTESRLDARTVAAIDLIGVAPAHQGRGIGAALVARFIHEWRARASELRVGTQAANLASLRLYESSGFRAEESSYVLHAHYDRGQLCA